METRHMTFGADIIEFAKKDAYDPLYEDEKETWDDETKESLYGYIGDPGMLAPQSPVEEVPELSPREKMENLFGSMLPFKRDLLAIMDFCRTPRSIAEVEEFVNEQKKRRNSVYSAASFCQMLADADALEKIDEDGNLYEDVEVEPIEVEDEFGNVVLQPGTPPPAFWRITEEGAIVADEDNPMEVLKGIIADKSRYEHIFLQILQCCDTPTGAPMGYIQDQVNDDPVLVDPPKSAQFFMDYLDRNGAIVWEGGWKTTEIGKQLLALLQA